MDFSLRLISRPWARRRKQHDTMRARIAPTANPGPAPIATALTGYSEQDVFGEVIGVIVAVLVAEVVDLEAVAVVAVFLFKTHVVPPEQL